MSVPEPGPDPIAPTKAVANPALLSIAGLDFHIEWDPRYALDAPDPTYQAFFNPTSPPPGEAVNIQLRIDEPAVAESGRCIFDTEESWALYDTDRGYLIALHPPGHADQPLWSAEVDREFREVALRCQNRFLHGGPDHPSIANVMQYPLDQVLLIHRLALASGALVHSTGLVIDGRGLLCAGASGAGKSTLCKLVEGNRAIASLSDDRVVIREHGDSFSMHGTPWAGEAGIAENAEAPLHSLLFLSQSDHNAIRPLEPAAALKRLLPVMSVPWYDKALTGHLLDLCERLLARVPCHELAFTRDASVQEVLLDHAQHLD